MISVIRLSWADGILSIDYTQDDDIRDVGGRPAMMTHQLIVDADHPDFEEAQEIRDAAHDLVRDIVAAWSTSEPWKEPEDEPDEPDDDED